MLTDSKKMPASTHIQSQFSIRERSTSVSTKRTATTRALKQEILPRPPSALRLKTELVAYDQKLTPTQRLADKQTARQEVLPTSHGHSLLSDTGKMLTYTGDPGTDEELLRCKERDDERRGEPLHDFCKAGLYRVWLIVATVLFVVLLLRLQEMFAGSNVTLSTWQRALQWAELSWLLPVPVSLMLWLGWFLHAEAVRPPPRPIHVPLVSVTRKPQRYGPPRPAKLVFRLLTRGDNVEVLRDSVEAVHLAFERYQRTTGPYRVEVISERAVQLQGVAQVYVVPSAYVTRNGSRFKARALTYMQELMHPQIEDWHIYLDEESCIDEVFLAGVYRFIKQVLAAEHDPAKKHKPAGYIGQGAILYHGGDWFFRGADGLRTGEDIGKFRFQYGLGVPLVGMHGSFVVVRGQDEARLSFDVGPANSITEDTAWALRAWARGYRFCWIEGFLHEQPPQRALDFVKQRSRWLSGLRLVALDHEIPLRYRVFLGVSTALWQVSFLTVTVAIVAIFIHVSSFLWVRIPADFAWATYILAYLQGVDLQIQHARNTSPAMMQARGIRRLLLRSLAWLVVPCCSLFSLIEAWGIIHSVRNRQGFFVIHKPSLATRQKTAARASEALRPRRRAVKVEAS